MEVMVEGKVSWKCFLFGGVEGGGGIGGGYELV